MISDERIKMLDTAYLLRKAEKDITDKEIKQRCIQRAEEIEVSILEPLPEPIEIEGQMVQSVDLMTVRDFEEHVISGAFNNYDGSGYYATETHQSRLMAIPSEILQGKITQEFTHVAWYNK